MYMNTILLFLTHIFCYYLACLYFYRYDKKFIEKSEENKTKYYNSIKGSLVNQFCYTLPIMILIAENINNITNIAEKYTFIENLWRVFLIGNLASILFYIVHRILHIRYFYKNIHYEHHTFITPVAPAGLYARPLEHIFGNTLPLLCAYLYIGCSYYSLLLLIALISINVPFAHTVHDIKYFNLDHVYHHKYFKFNYGFGGYIDKIFGTHLKL